MVKIAKQMNLKLYTHEAPHGANVKEKEFCPCTRETVSGKSGRIDSMWYVELLTKIECAQSNQEKRLS